MAALTNKYLSIVADAVFIPDRPGKRTATYHIEVLQKDEVGDRKIAICQAVVYRKSESLPFWERE